MAPSLLTAAEGGYGQNILGKELHPSPEGTLLLDGEFGIYPDLVFFTYVGNMIFFSLRERMEQLELFGKDVICMMVRKK